MMNPSISHVAVIAGGLPSEDQMLPLANRIVGVSEDVLAASTRAAVQAEIPTVTFTGRIRKIGVALENNPASAIARMLIAVIDRGLAALLVFQRPDPEFEAEGN